jgi:hypothetical protein
MDANEHTVNGDFSMFFNMSPVFTRLFDCAKIVLKNSETGITIVIDVIIMKPASH